ncbi:uncharacterized protein CEXT_21891 [Caerostris extrusa]|uniref:Uncharacterized protein n=1 Tax=Caerostris extrusa TaxID=172846 RepID=A0AAV4MJH4_CAEEX|nr:uncharacterized protein CEXT_21891 [Caerostris extrusa]
MDGGWPHAAGQRGHLPSGFLRGLLRSQTKKVVVQRSLSPRTPMLLQPGGVDEPPVLHRRHGEEAQGQDEPHGPGVVFNSKTEKWEDGPTLPVARMGCVAVVYDNDLYVVGGFDPESDVAIRNVNQLAPGAISWQVSAPLPSHLFGIAAVSCDAMQ